MNTYEIELKRTSFVTYTVEALDEDSAENEAWEQLAQDGKTDHGASWEVESIECKEAAQ